MIVTDNYHSINVFLFYLITIINVSEFEIYPYINPKKSNYRLCATKSSLSILSILYWDAEQLSFFGWRGLQKSVRSFILQIYKYNNRKCNLKRMGFAEIEFLSKVWIWIYLSNTNCSFIWIYKKRYAWATNLYFDAMK